MTKSEQKIQKTCCFYASDFHLEMTILPYINKKIDENKKIIIITENNLQESVKTLLSRINIKNEDKILNLNWNNKQEKTNNYKDSVVVINGTQKFVEYNFNKIENEAPSEIINCFLFDEVKNNMDKIVTSHNSTLNNLRKNY